MYTSLTAVTAVLRRASCILEDGREARLEGLERINRAVDSDVVAVSVDDELDSSGRPQAQVVGIVERNWRLLAGSLLVDSKEEAKMSGSSSWCWFVPMSRSFPRVKLATRRATELVGQRLGE